MFILGIIPNWEPGKGSGRWKMIFPGEKLGRQLAGQRTGAPQFLAMKNEKEQRCKMAAFDENNLEETMIDKLTSMIGKLSTQHNPFYLECIRVKDNLLQTQEEVTNNTITIETDSMTKAGHVIKVDAIKCTIRTSEVGTTLEIIVIEVNIVKVIGRTLRIEKDHMTEAESEIEVIVEDLGGAEERVDLEIEIGLTLRIKVGERRFSFKTFYEGVSKEEKESS